MGILGFLIFMALNDIIVPKENAQGDFTETVLTPAQIGAQVAGDYATLVGGTVPANQLPSYVDDVIEVANAAARPNPGETGKIYITTDNNKVFRWSGSAYVEIVASPGSTDAVPEGSTNLYHTALRAAAAAPVQSVAGRTGAVTLAVADVSGAVASTDARLSDSRQPTLHGSSHHTGGTDALAPNDISAAWALVVAASSLSGNATLPAARNRQITYTLLVASATVTLPSTDTAAGDFYRVVSAAGSAGTITVARLSGGNPSTLTTLAANQAASFRFDGSNWGLITVDTHTHTGSEVNVGTTANLPLKTGTNGVVEAGSYGTSAGTFCEGNDARLSDDRDPNLHAASHAAGGSDPVLPVALYDAADDSIVLEYDSSSGWVGLTSASTFRTQLELGTAATSNTGDFAASGSITTSGLTQATSRLIGRTSSGTGAIEEIQIGSGLSLSAGQLSATASGGITAVGASTADVLSVSGSDLVADDAGADRIIFWDDSESKLRYLEAGSGLSISGTTMTVTATGGATNLWIPASAWIPRTTNGCGVDSREQATNRVNTDELLFEAATSEEFAQALVVMPSNYNNSTLSARFYWSAASGGSGGVAWGISGRAYGDDDPIDAASGTRVVVTDTFITANDVHVTSATGAVTIAGTPAANKAINFQIVREIGNASDTLGVDARLLGVEIIFN
jgi:hypothetical protein